MENKEISLYQSKGVLWIVLSAALLCLAGIVWVVRFLLERDISAIIIGFVIAVGLFFVWLIYITIRQIANKEPLLVISDRGISGRYILPRGEFLSWNEIDKIFVYPFRFQKFIGIEVKDPETVLAKLPEGKRRLANWSRNMGYPTFSISTGLFSMSTTEFVGVLDNFRKEHKE